MMRRVVAYWLACIVAGLTGYASGAPELQEQARSGAVQSRIALRADLWFPVNGRERAARPGFGIEILKAVWKPAGYRLDYRTMPWDRSLELVRDGSADCVIGAYRTDAPDLLYPSEPLAFDGIAVYATEQSDATYEGMTSLQSWRIGVIGGYSYGEKLDRWLSERAGEGGVEVMRGNAALEKNLRKLLSGRLDVVLESPLVMEARLEAMGLQSRVRRLALITRPMPIFVACRDSQSSRQWLRVHDEGVRRLRTEGELSIIYGRYGIDGGRQDALRRDWSPSLPGASR